MRRRKSGWILRSFLQPACKVCTAVRQSCWASFLPVLQTADPPGSGIPRRPPAPAWCSAFPAGWRSFAPRPGLFVCPFPKIFARRVIFAILPTNALTAVRVEPFQMHTLTVVPLADNSSFTVVDSL